MTMNIRYGGNPADIALYDTARLRAEFLVEGHFQGGTIQFTYTRIDRMIVGACVPTPGPIGFGEGDDVGTEAFFDAREMGVANLGGPGTAWVNGREFHLKNCDVLYVGRGAQRVIFDSDSIDNPARFYMNSVPAGADLPHRLISRAESKVLTLGDPAKSNLRRLAMYIHPEVAPSCLLMMGITDPAPGSVWNTMPPHLHERRMEAYCYFDMGPQDRVIHLMGRPDQTRHLIVASEDIVLSPAWSIHMGAGTGPYAFVWGMTGENQAYKDVTPVAVADLR